MDLLDRLLAHDTWTTRQLLACCKRLTAEQLDRAFDIGPRSVRATLLHLIRNVEVWADLMSGGAVREDASARADGGTIDAMIVRLDRAASDLARVARGVAARGVWDERWLDRLDDPPTEKTFGGAIAHVITHGMHHRAQLLHMLRRLGVADLPEGDVLSWEQQAEAPHAPMRSRFVDVSHDVEHGMITYKGLPAPIVCDFLSREASRARYAPGTEFHIGRIDMVANTGTYVDAPFHRYADGKDLAQLPLESLANLDTLVARIPPGSGRAIDRLLFSRDEVRGRAVLVNTGWDRHWRTDRYFEGHPHLTGELAEWLVAAGAALVGIDSFNIDCVDGGERPVHSVLLRNDVPIVEHLRGLDGLPDRGARFFAVPVKVRAFGTFPVRAFAIVDPVHGER